MSRANDRLFAVQEPVEDLPILLDDPLRPELVDVLLVGVDYLAAKGLRVDILGRVERVILPATWGGSYSFNRIVQ